MEEGKREKGWRGGTGREGTVRELYMVTEEGREGNAREGKGR